jgi:hypothetical protein
MTALLNESLTLQRACDKGTATMSFAGPAVSVFAFASLAP